MWVCVCGFVGMPFQEIGTLEWLVKDTTVPIYYSPINRTKSIRFNFYRSDDYTTMNSPALMYLRLLREGRDEGWSVSDNSSACCSCSALPPTVCACVRNWSTCLQ